jgi:hypothetical protein
MTAPSYVHAEGGIGAVFRYAADSFLSRGSLGGTLRSFTIGLVILIYWSGLSWALAPSPSVLPSWLAGLPFPADVLARVVAALFAPAVLTHLIPVIGGTWLAYRLASHYLADLFELESFGLAARYLRGAVWGLGYDTLAVSSGDLNQLDWTSPMVRVGGPGLLAVHLGFAAVFETAEGHPRVYGPAPRRFVQGFERLRDVVDLRDQMRPVEEVRSTTRDGVEVFARDVQMMFRVYGGGQPRGLRDPYPFTEEAVRRLVYAQVIGDHGLERWTDALPDIIRSEIGGFVSGLTLEGFLALQPTSDDARPSSPAAFHIPRRRLTEQLHTDELRQRLQQAGLELAWVGVGTWEIAAAGRSTDSSRVHTLSSVWRDVQRLHRVDQRPDTDASAGARPEGKAEPVLQSLAEAWETAVARGLDPKAALLERIRTVLLDLRQRPADLPPSAQARALDAVLEHLASLRPSIGSGAAIP